MRSFINRVTITGAGDDTKPEELINISKTHPYVEWGILLADEGLGSNRFPSKRWINSFFSKILESKLPIKTSGHLCYSWLHDLCLGKATFTEEIKEWDHFNRFQLNFHGQPTRVNEEKFVELLQKISQHIKDVQFIFQYENVNDHLLDLARQKNVNAVPLFDLSHGAGILPEKWPRSLENIYCGYAGGLSPENLNQQLEKISKVAGHGPIWIDTETMVRTNGNFDINKVVTFLEIADPWIINK